MQWSVVAVVLAAGLAWMPARCQSPAVAPAPTPTPTAAEILKRAADAALANQSAIGHYAWHDRTIISTLGAPGKPAHVHSDETDDSSEVNGLEYDRVIARDGKPLAPADQKKEDRKLADFIRKHSTPEARAKALKQQARDRQQQTDLIRAIPQAFQVQLQPSPAACGCYVISLTPSPHYKTHDHHLQLLRHVTATLWVHRGDFGLMRLQVRFIQTVSVGWILARVGKGGTVTMEQSPVDGHWFPSRSSAHLPIRFMLVKGYRVVFEDVYSDYRQFHASARVLSSGAIKH
ncbi:MAG: hypothetical protein ACRD1M_11415 [Terriglobales bacterium]